MSGNSNAKKDKQLGMSRSLANHRLNRIILFKLIKLQYLDVCFRCGKKIETIDSLSIEHKIPWLDSENPVGLFFDLDNIAFSHLGCNSSAHRVNNRVLHEHGTYIRYQDGCRCNLCQKASSNTRKKSRDNNPEERIRNRDWHRRKRSSLIHE
jgi:hypothetical protein